jgi:hypothetical protein
MSTPTSAPSAVDPAALRQVMRRFPATPIWFGPWTRRWWALTADRLVEAETPAALGYALAACADPAAAPHVPHVLHVPSGPPAPGSVSAVRPPRRPAGSWRPPRNAPAPSSERAAAPVG